jgi:hypothetical protein
LDIRSLSPLNVGDYYYFGPPCNVYRIESSKTASGSDPIFSFDGSAGSCVNAYNLCNA